MRKRIPSLSRTGETEQRLDTCASKLTSKNISEFILVVSDAACIVVCCIAKSSDERTEVLL